MRVRFFNSGEGRGKNIFSRPWSLHLNSLHHDPPLRVVLQAGCNGDAVVRRPLEIAPVVVGDDLHQGHRVGSGAVDGGVGDGVASHQVLDGTDVVLSPRLWPQTPKLPSQAEVEL